MSNYKKIYDQLLKSGDLYEVFPYATGEWSKDKKEFTDLHNVDNYIISDEEEQEEGIY